MSKYCIDQTVMEVAPFSGDNLDDRPYRQEKTATLDVCVNMYSTFLTFQRFTFYILIFSYPRPVVSINSSSSIAANKRKL